MVRFKRDTRKVVGYSYTLGNINRGEFTRTALTKALPEPKTVRFGFCVADARIIWESAQLIETYLWLMGSVGGWVFVKAVGLIFMRRQKIRGYE